jgi:chromosome partitioning protein
MASIAIMNAKGGVGKSTLTMALAETLSAYHGKRILLIDSDGQMSLSVMMMAMGRLTGLQNQGRTISDYLRSLLPGNREIDWRACVASDAGDVYDAESISLIAGDMDLTVVEQDLVEARLKAHMRERCRSLLRDAAQEFDLVLVDCAPGISMLTECWLRECDWHLIPVRPDVLAVSGFQYLRNFKNRTPDAPFARLLGMLVNMKQATGSDDTIHDLLLANRDMACFARAVPLIQHIQKSALCSAEERSFHNKYPGDAGHALRAITAEILERVSNGNEAQDGVGHKPKLSLVA